jgi:hypothetical protein
MRACAFSIWYMTQPQIIEKLVTFDEDKSTGDLIVHHTQELPDDYLSSLRANKIDPANGRMGDMYLVASVPTAIVDELLRRYNFDVMREPVRETMKMLRKLHLDLFIQTTKRI